MKVGKQVLKRRILETKRPMIICVSKQKRIKLKRITNKNSKFRSL